MPDGSEKCSLLNSNMLNVSEKNYEQINKDDLALVFSIKYFQKFLQKEFILRTDHKPFVSIFGEKKGILRISALHRLDVFYYHVYFMSKIVIFIKFMYCIFV